MKRYIFILLVFALLVNMQGMFAQPGNKDNPPPRMMDRMGKMLNLTDEQKSKIDDLRLSFEKEKLPLQSKIHELRNELKLELTNDSFDETKVNQTLNQLEDLRKEMSMMRIKHLRDVRNILNADQKKKFDMHILSSSKFGGDRQRHQMQMQPERFMMRGR